MQQDKAEEKIIMDDTDLMENYAVCEVCGKPCGKIIEKGKVYHWDCAFEVCKEIRQKVLESKGIKFNE